MCSAAPSDERVSDRVAVLGCTGFVGQHLAATWKQRASPSTTLRLLVHRSRPDWMGGIAGEIHNVDLDDARTLKEALADCTVLINLLRPNGDGWLAATMTRVLPTISGKVGTMIYASSIDVFGAAPEAVVTEATLPRPLTPYAKEHLTVEALVAGAPVASTIMRLGAIFGTGGHNLIAMAEQVAREPTWKLGLRRAVNGTRRMHLVSVETVADALHLIARRHTERRGERLLITEDAEDSNNFAFVQQRFAAAFARQIPPLGPMPPFVLRSALRLRGGANTDPFRRFSGEKLQRLGLKPSQPFTSSIDHYAAALANEYGQHAS